MENLGIDPKLLIAQTINFVVFFIIFRLYIAKPFMSFIHKEKQKEHEKEKLQHEIEEKHQRMVEQEAAWKAELQKEREQVVADTKKAASKVKEEMLVTAKKEADELIAKAKKQIDMERDQLYKDVRNRTIDLSMMIIQKGLKDYLNEDVKKSVTRYIVDNLSKDIEKYES